MRRRTFLCHLPCVCRRAHRLERTGTAEDFEDEMLDDAAAERRPNSRLSCQIRMTDELDGLEVEIAPEQ